MRDHRPELNSTLIESINENIRNKASFLIEIDDEIKLLLPHLKNICRVGNYRNGVLILECASSSWAMRLNYERQYLLSALRKTKIASLMTIEVKINPDLAQAEIERYRKFMPSKAPISKQSADHLLSLTECASDKMTERLKRIAALAK